MFEIDCLVVAAKHVEGAMLAETASVVDTGESGVEKVMEGHDGKHHEKGHINVVLGVAEAVDVGH